MLKSKRKKPTVEEIKQHLEDLWKNDQRYRDQNVEEVALSSWANGLNMQLAQAQLKLAEDGWRAFFPALFDMNRVEVPAKLIQTQYGLCWALLDKNKRFTGEFVGYPYSRRTGERMIAKKYRGKYQVIQILKPAYARITGRGTGLSGTAWVEVVEEGTRPEDDDLPEEPS